jgi:Protein of unknown function (DUF2939)
MAAEKHQSASPRDRAIVGLLTNMGREMRARWPVLAVFVAMGAGYLGYPYATLYRLDTAVRHADAAALAALVDWYAVREGLKEDICDLVLDEPADARPSNELPPFGESFVRGMTANALDRAVTPEKLVSMTSTASDTPRAEAHVEWAFFSNPTQFSVNVRTDAAAEPIRVVMELRRMRWQVRRVWLPNELLERAGFGT